MEQLQRIGVSLEGTLLQQFDTLIERQGYTNRSEAIRDLIRLDITKKKIKDSSLNVIGTLTMIYDHHTGNLTTKLLELQHKHHQEILSTTHIHINHYTCLEVLVLKGKAGNIQHLADTIKALKGIKHGELVITQTGF